MPEDLPRDPSDTDRLKYLGSLWRELFPGWPILLFLLAVYLLYKLLDNIQL